MKMWTKEIRFDVPFFDINVRCDGVEGSPRANLGP